MFAKKAAALKRLKHITIIASILLFTGNILYAQRYLQYNIDINNGLPSNHVYYSLADRFGYLWMATEKGVVRYNGYNFRTYGLAEGLANDDVWHLYEDKKGRIWLFSISPDIGYIYNNNYKKPYIRNNHQAFYPTLFNEDSLGIFFFNCEHGEDITGWVSSEKNDTITEYPIRINTLIDQGNYIINKNRGLLLSSEKGIYNINYINPENKPTLVCQYKEQDSGFNSMTGIAYIYFKDYLITFNSPTGTIYLTNTINCNRRKLTIQYDKLEKLVTLYRRKDNLFIITNKKVYVLDSNIRIKKVYYGDSLIRGFDLRKQEILSFYEDSLWNRCVSTARNGIYFNYKQDNFKKNNEYNLSGFVYVGNDNKETSFWWNKSMNTLIAINAKGQVKKLTDKRFFNVMRVIPYTDKKVLILESSNIYLLGTDDMKFHLFYDPYRHYKLLGQPGIRSKEKIKKHVSRGENYRNVLVVNPYDMYSFDGSSGLRHLMINKDTLTMQYICEERLLSYEFDSSRKTIWAYGNNAIYLYDINAEKEIPAPAMLTKTLRHSKIEKILFDNTYRNIFIKNDSRLLLYNNNRLIKILDNYNMASGYVALKNNTLILAGKFGILFCKITGPGLLSNPVVYDNYKNTNYNYIEGTGISVTSGKVLLNTDKGMYSIPIPTDSEMLNAKPKKNNYNLILSYGDSCKLIKPSDTVVLNQTIDNLEFDLIKPDGNGAVKYKSRIAGIDTTWVSLTSNVIGVGKLAPGRYYDIQLVVSDDIWQSNPVSLKVYIIPLWWQTVNGKRMIGSGILLIGALLFWLVMYLTKRKTNRNNDKKNMKLELRNLRMALELKSIYSQINPHFIFNTLSTGLYYIKKKRTEEAYSHISAFSELLRSYIKSSRNKYITLAEEIENLENYIKLQQSRFENRFEYEIILNDVNPIKNKVPTLLLQPLVENAIAHGLFHKEETGHLKIEFKYGTDENELISIIDDDGIGIEKAKLLKEDTIHKTESYGSDLVKELIDIFNTHEPININIQYINKQLPDTGTKVILTIKRLDNA